MPQLIGREDVLSGALQAIRSPSTAAVFVVGDAGIGKSSVLGALAEELADEASIVRIHGSSSLAQVPYGVLSPYLAELPVEEADSPVAVLRAFWARFDRDRAGKPPLLLVDDAHDLDPASAAVIVELVSANWARLVAASRTRPGLPDSMLQLWYDGLAQRFDLAPLSPDQVQDFVTARLDGVLLPSVSQFFAGVSGGNPLYLECLLEEAQASDNLVRSHDVWLLTGPVVTQGRGLADVLKNQLLRRPPEEREALSLIALAEPVPAALIERMVGADLVQSLVDNQLVSVSEESETVLRLWHPMYGEALRHLVSASRSLQLRQRLLAHMDSEPKSAEGLLRMVSWSLECGVEVADGPLLKAAWLASKLFQNDLALKAASMVRDPGLLTQARAVMARAYYNIGRYRQAGELLEHNFSAEADLSGVLTGSLLWAATRTALGHSHEQIAADAAALREAVAPERTLGYGLPDDVVAKAHQRSDLVELMALSLEGDYAALTRKLEELSVPDGTADERPVETRIFCYVMESEVLLASGRAVQAQELARRAWELLPEGNDELFFFSEFILVRYLSAAIEAGDWEAAETALARYTASSSLGLILFGGSVNSAKGLILLRQGKVAEALRLLAPALEALRLNDPQHLFSLSAAMAFYAAATLGEQEQALAYLKDFTDTEDAGARYTRAVAATFVAAGQERLHGDGRGLDKLHGLLPEAQRWGLSGLELQILCTCVDLGDLSQLDRLLQVTAAVEGERAGAWHKYAGALAAGDGELFMEAAEALAAVRMTHAARECYLQAAEVFEADGDRARARTAEAMRRGYDDELGLETDSRQAPVRPVLDQLTKRERDIVTLAVEGLSDRQIADRLMVSVRTVEGHLYRSYAKLGVNRREQLQDVFPG